LPADTIVFNRYELLWTAIGEAFAMHATGYRHRCDRKGLRSPASGVATIKGQLANMRDGGFISAHDFFIASCIADVMCGGDVEAGSVVDENGCSTWNASTSCSWSRNPQSAGTHDGNDATGKPVRN